jgi:GGDEF domain-containing protein
VAVTSKRKDAITENNPGLFDKVKQGLDRGSMSRNDKNQPNKESTPETSLTSEDYLAAWNKIEKALVLPEAGSDWVDPLLQEVLDYSGLSYAILTEIMPGAPRHYSIKATVPEQTKLIEHHPIEAGLAGWVHTKLLKLALPKLNTEDNYSYLFYHGDPYRRATSFYGWPLLYNDELCGALILAGTNKQILPEEKLNFLNTLPLRLAAHVQHDRLLLRVVELRRLDPQTGLPHRSYYLQRLERLIDLNSSIKGLGVHLEILAISGLGRFAQANGQAETKDFLRAIAQQLLGSAQQEWEVGHISYGLFALAVPIQEKEELEKALELLKKRLSEWPMFSRAGRANFFFHQSSANYPAEANKPEDLLETALIKLASLE